MLFPSAGPWVELDQDQAGAQGTVPTLKITIYIQAGVWEAFSTLSSVALSPGSQEPACDTGSSPFRLRTTKAFILCHQQWGIHSGQAGVLVLLVFL